MGMRAEVEGIEIKYSWPLSVAIKDAIGDDRLGPMLDDYYLELTKEDVYQVLVNIHYMLKKGIEDIISEPGYISEQYVIKVGWLAWGIFPALSRWHSEADPKDVLAFG